MTLKFFWNRLLRLLLSVSSKKEGCAVWLRGSTRRFWRLRSADCCTHVWPARQTTHAPDYSLSTFTMVMMSIYLVFSKAWSVSQVVPSHTIRKQPNIHTCPRTDLPWMLCLPTNRLNNWHWTDFKSIENTLAFRCVCVGGGVEEWLIHFVLKSSLIIFKKKMV